MIRRRKGRGGRPTVGLLLIAGLVIAQNVQAAAVRVCPHHGGPDHALVQAPGGPEAYAHHGTSAPDAPHPGHAPSPIDVSDSDAGPHEDTHHGPCDCLGPCGASPALHPPTPPAESALAEPETRRVLAQVTTDLEFVRHARPFVLPYPNAPPA